MTDVYCFDCNDYVPAHANLRGVTVMFGRQIAVVECPTCGTRLTRFIDVPTYIALFRLLEDARDFGRIAAEMTINLADEPDPA